MRNFELILSLS